MNSRSVTYKYLVEEEFLSTFVVLYSNKDVMLSSAVIWV